MVMSYPLNIETPNCSLEMVYPTSVVELLTGP